MSNARNDIAEGIRTLAGWAAGVKAEDIPGEIQVRAIRVLADDLSAIIGARDEPEVRAFHQHMLGRRHPGEATVFRGGRERTDRVGAAVANAVAADWLELDEGYRVTPCHAGLYVIPALLAEAEARNLSFGELLRALVLGYEVVTRVARSFVQRAANMQSHGRYSAVGAATAVALSRHANPLDAMSAAVTMTGPSPRTHLHTGILVRNVWPAMGAWAGTMAVDWGECGIAGTPSAFYDVYADVLGGTAEPQRLTAGLGERWAIEDGYTKIYACCQHLHSAVEAAIDMKGKIAALGGPGEIARVRVETHALALPLVNPRPQTTLSAKFSMSHALAAALVTGSGGADAFAAVTLSEPAIASLRERVSVGPRANELPPPNDRPANVIVEMKNGTTVRGECLSARGGPDRPLPPDTVFDKMESLASPVYPRIRPVFAELMKSGSAGRGWSDIVTEICG